MSSAKWQPSCLAPNVLKSVLNLFLIETRGVSIYRRRLTSIEIPIIEIRRSHDQNHMEISANGENMECAAFFFE